MRRWMVLVIAALMSTFLISCGSDTQEASVELTVAEAVGEEVLETEEEILPEEPQEAAVEPFAPTAVNLGDYLHGVEPDSVNTDHEFVTYETYYLPANYRQLVFDYTSELVDGDYRLNYVKSTRTEDDDSSWYIMRFLYDDGTGLKSIEKDAECHLAVALLQIEGNSKIGVRVYYHKDITFVEDPMTASYGRIGEESPYLKEIREAREERERKAAEEAKEEAAAKAESEPVSVTETVDKDASFIPEFSAFLNRSPSEEKDRYYGGNRKYYQKISLDTQDTVVSEVLNLLKKERYQLDLIEKVEDGDRIEYNYRYTGNVGMEMIHSKNDDTRYYHLQFTVYNRNNDNGTYGIHFHYCPEFVEENVGYTVSENIAKDSSGGGGGTVDFEGGDLPDHSKLQCLTCRGSKDCGSCFGKGYKMRDGIRSDCTRCTDGDCPSCGGSGTR